MARPAPRRPRTEDPSALAPAPDAGQPFSTEPTPGKTRGRTGHALGLRIPEDLHERLTQTSERTDIPMTKIVIRGIRAELDRLDALD